MKLGMPVCPFGWDDVYDDPHSMINGMVSDVYGIGSKNDLTSAGMCGKTTTEHQLKSPLAKLRTSLITEFQTSPYDRHDMHI